MNSLDAPGRWLKTFCGTERLRALLSGVFLACVLALAAWAYAPGLHGPTLLDDFNNLTALQALDQQEGFAIDVVLGNLSGPLGRPVSMASFAIERLYLDRGLYGQKSISLLLHLINACLVFGLCRKIFREFDYDNPWLACTVAALWVTAPLLVSTTLYVVQRMTMLACLFTLLSLLAYCHARQRQLLSQSCLYYFLIAAICVPVAALSKENGLLAVPLLVLTEVFVFGFKALSARQAVLLKLSHLCLVLLPVLAFILLIALRADMLFGGYNIRDFTLVERLLTQSRILLDYLAQLTWPAVHRMGVYHDDVQASRSLLSPTSTLYATATWILVLAGLLASGIYRKFRPEAFGVGFFLVAHLMESTVLPLELYFEHRNYLPAVGIFFALTSLAARLGRRYALVQPWLPLFMLFFLGRNLVLLGSQSVIWSDRYLLHIEMANSHPRSERALLALAQTLATDGHIESALALKDQAVQLQVSEGLGNPLLTGVFYCLAGQPLPATFLQGYVPDDKTRSTSLFSDHVRYLGRLVMTDRCSREDGQLLAERLRISLSVNGALQASREIYGAMLLLENHLENYESALEYTELLLGREPENVLGLQFKLYLASLLQLDRERDQALEMLKLLQDSGRLSRQEAYNLELFDVNDVVKPESE